MKRVKVSDANRARRNGLPPIRAGTSTIHGRDKHGQSTLAEQQVLWHQDGPPPKRARPDAPPLGAQPPEFADALPYTYDPPDLPPPADDGWTNPIPDETTEGAKEDTKEKKQRKEVHMFYLLLRDVLTTTAPERDG